MFRNRFAIAAYAFTPDIGLTSTTKISNFTTKEIKKVQMNRRELIFFHYFLIKPTFWAVPHPRCSLEDPPAFRFRVDMGSVWLGSQDQVLIEGFFDFWFFAGINKYIYIYIYIYLLVASMRFAVNFYVELWSQNVKRTIMDPFREKSILATGRLGLGSI